MNKDCRQFPAMDANSANGSRYFASTDPRPSRYLDLGVCQWRQRKLNFEWPFGLLESASIRLHLYLRSWALSRWYPKETVLLASPRFERISQIFTMYHLPDEKLTGIIAKTLNRLEIEVQKQICIAHAERFLRKCTRCTGCISSFPCQMVYRKTGKRVASYRKFKVITKIRNYKWLVSWPILYRNADDIYLIVFTINVFVTTYMCYKS